MIYVDLTHTQIAVHCTCGDAFIQAIIYEMHIYLQRTYNKIQVSVNAIRFHVL